jgi:Tfp pilus assembly protein PilO
MKKPLSTKKGRPQTWLITLLLAAAAIAYVVFLFLPSQRSIDELRSQVQERRQQIMQSQSLTRTVSHAHQRLTAAQGIGQEWRTMAPRQAQLVTHFARLTQQAEAAGVALDRLDPLPAVELNLIAQQNVTMQFHAPFAATFDLLKRLETLPGTLWVRDLRLHANSDADNTLRGELTLTIFVDRADYAN